MVVILNSIYIPIYYVHRKIVVENGVASFKGLQNCQRGMRIYLSIPIMCVVYITMH